MPCPVQQIVFQEMLEVITQATAQLERYDQEIERAVPGWRWEPAVRALKCGFPERFAQQALGHNSKAVYRAYAKHAEVTVPSLADWEKD